MRKKFLFAMLSLFCFTGGLLAQETLELPISEAPGYGVFHASVAGVGPEREDNPYRLPLKGIPSTLKDVKRYHFILDEKQFFYQSFLNKKISEEMFNQRMQMLKYAPDAKDLSKNPLRTSVYIITGENEKGRRVWLADTDTDLDFSDEKNHYLLTYAPPFDFAMYKALADNATRVKYQRLLKGKVVEEVIPLAVARPTEGDHLFFNYPKHYVATAMVNGVAHEISLESGSFLSKYLDEEGKLLK